MKIKRLLIANRGEIAVRVIRAAKALEIHTLQIYSEADLDTLAVKLADESVCVGPAAAAKSYLNVDKIIEVAKEYGIDAVHPGYGFLSENADFADAIEASGIAFVGPSGDSIRQLGNKATARQIAEAAGVPTVPGSNGKINNIEEGRDIALSVGFPVMIKASAGGGGRGIRIANSIEELNELYPQASAEAEAIFGDGSLYMEKLISSARHIEVQLLGDGSNFVHCYERECSLQRRRQKVWEEAPAINLPADVREALCGSAIALARQVKYKGAGTVKYLYDSATQSFYFIEVNTRIQVEHPITEAITGIDLVQEMIRVAGGEMLSIKQEDVTVTGHAIECRINAEDPSKDFMPWPGLVEELVEPSSPNVRFDTFIYSGYSISPFYDSLLGKLIVHGKSREDCINSLVTALEELKVKGIPTTIPLHAALAQDKDVIAGNYDTKFLERWLESTFNSNKSSSREASLSAIFRVVAHFPTQPIILLFVGSAQPHHKAANFGFGQTTD